VCAFQIQSLIINPKWHVARVNGFNKKTNEKTNLIDESRDKGPNWDFLKLGEQNEIQK